jgi:hypothetical protein
MILGQRAMAQTFTLTTVTDAIIVPPPPRIPTKRQLQLAVLDANLNVLPLAICGTNRLTSAGFIPSESLIQNPEHLPGTWLFGGLASHHFGHQITRSLGRLAALPLTGPIDGIVFAPLDSRARDPAAIKLLTRLLAGLGITAPIRVLTEPTRVDHLVVGDDLFSENIACIADPAYVDWVRKSFAPATKPVIGSKLYVTRTQLDPTLGRLLNEDILEQNLSRQGYEIYVPERHSLPDQLRTYASAETIVTTDGSQGHVMAFARQPGQNIITIARRFDAPASLLNHIDSFGHGLTKSSHTYLNCLFREWWPRQRTDNLSLGEADFADLCQNLIRLHALHPTAAADWQIPSQAQIDASKSRGRQPDDRLLSTAERSDFLTALRQSRKIKLAADFPMPIKTIAKQSMGSAVAEKPKLQTDHRANGLRYFRILKGLHQRLKPDWYLEIGTQAGSSLRLVDGNFVAIGPKFQLQHEAPLKGREMIFYQDTSDAFFKTGSARRLKGKINLAFLDGLHHYEALLRDFTNTEPLMAPGGMVLLHDCLPYNSQMADRVQPPNAEWAGDVWKTLLILMADRPDLQIDILDAAPTGLVVIRKLDGTQKKAMKARYKSLIKTWDPITLETYPGSLAGFWDRLTVQPAGRFLDSLSQA